MGTRRTVQADALFGGLADGEPLNFDQNPPLLYPDYHGAIAFDNFSIVGDFPTVQFFRPDHDLTDGRPETWTRVNSRVVNGQVISVFFPVLGLERPSTTLRAGSGRLRSAMLYWGAYQVPGSAVKRFVYARVGLRGIRRRRSSASTIRFSTPAMSSTSSCQVLLMPGQQRNERFRYRDSQPTDQAWNVQAGHGMRIPGGMPRSWPGGDVSANIRRVFEVLVEQPLAVAISETVRSAADPGISKTWHDDVDDIAGVLNLIVEGGRPATPEFREGRRARRRNASPRCRAPDTRPSTASLIEAGPTSAKALSMALESRTGKTR